MESHAKTKTVRYVRRFGVVTVVIALAIALLLGAVALILVLLDVYPVVPAEGFSARRKAETVFLFFLTGGVCGLVLSLPAFLLSLLLKPLPK